MSEHRLQNSTLTPVISGSSAASGLPWWPVAIVTIGALLMMTGGIIALTRPAMLVSPGSQINGATRVYAGYMASRNLAVAVALLIMLGMRARGALSNLMVLTAFIQLLDAGMDILEGRWTLVPGVLVYAIAFFIGAARLSGQAFWKADAWRDKQ